jgi:hypothetical protein
MNSRVILVAVASAAVAACSTSVLSPPEVVDTSGVRFAWVCDEHCVPELTEGTPQLPPCNVGTPLYAWAFGRFITVDAGCTTSDGGWGSTANRSRPLACADTLDCPQFTTGTFECRNGLCQNEDVSTFPTAVITWSQAFTLCYARVAREDTIDPLSTASQQVSDSVQQSCPMVGEPCTQPLPNSCMQP